MTEVQSKVAAIEACAQEAYDQEDRAWFYSAPLDHLTALWGVACATGAAWDDEVYDALAERGWFEEDQPEDRGPARDIVAGDTVKVFAHPAGMFGRTPPGGGGYGADVVGTVAVLTPIPLPGTALPGLQIIMEDGRIFEAVDTAVTVWRKRAND